jgi:hypothetical protein
MPPLKESRVLLNSKFFSVRATQPTPIDNFSIRQCIRNAQTYDSKVSTALETILHSGPRSLTKGLEDWNLEEGIILYRGHIYVPKDNLLRRDIINVTSLWDGFVPWTGISWATRHCVCIICVLEGIPAMRPLLVP